MSSMVERVCRYARLPPETAIAVAQTLERTGSLTEAIFCLRTMGLTHAEVAYALDIPQSRVWVILHGLPIASLLESGVCA